jgi:hypothetical protein
MIGYRDVKRLKYHAREFAMMMTNEEIDTVIAELVAARNLRGNQKRAPPQ